MQSGQIQSFPMRFSDVPFQLQATDINRHILNVDSRFREAGGVTADFFFRLLTPVKNVLRIRISSIEFPNNYYMFSKGHRNITLRLLYGPQLALSKLITVPEGNYSAFDMVDALNMSFEAAGIPWMAMEFNLVTGRFTFAGLQLFAIDMAVDGLFPAVTWDRPYNYGLGFNMGFSRGIFDSTTLPDPSGNFFVVSDQMSYFAGDAYVFLKINDFDCVLHTMDGSDFTALAKIVVKEPKNYMSFDDYASQHAKEVVFPTPQNLSRLHVQLLDAYGEIVPMDSSHFSFSIEVLEIMNLNLYNTVRDAFAVGWRV